MKKILLMVALLAAVAPLSAQRSVEEVLQRVERSNTTLEAQRRLTAAQKDEARTGNSLPDPTVELESLWGGAGRQNNSELTVAQAFDFPSVYSKRHQIARLRTEQLDNEALTVRQQVLLEAKLLCIDLSYLERQQQLMAERRSVAERLNQAWQERGQSGEATAMELNKVKTELASAQAAYALNESTLQSVRHQLTVMMGTESIHLEGLSYPSVEPLPAYEDLLVRFDAADPVLRSLEQQVDLSDKQVALQRGLALPRFELGYRHDFGVEGRFKGFKAGMSLPLFESRNRVRAARAQQAYANSVLDGERLTRVAQLRQLYDQAQLLDRSQKALQSPVEITQSIALLDKALAAGTLSVIDYFTEVGSYFETNTLRLQLERDYQAAVARLFRFEL